MLEDCERRHLIKKCTRCYQAIPVEQWLQHTLKQTCSGNIILFYYFYIFTNMFSVDELQCPLCLISIEPANDAGWKSHLMTGEGCSKLKKSRSPNKKKPATPTTTLKKKVIKK